jgi:hypothetical protein
MSRYTKIEAVAGARRESSQHLPSCALLSFQALFQALVPRTTSKMATPPPSKYAYGPNGLAIYVKWRPNVPVVQALLDKAATYPPEKKYNARAYINAAKICAELHFNIWDETVYGGNTYTRHAVKAWGVTEKMLDFIEKFYTDHRRPDIYWTLERGFPVYYLEFPEPKCINPDNQPAYEVLRQRAIECAGAWLQHKARAYSTAAVAVSRLPVSLKENRAALRGVKGIGSSSSLLAHAAV